LWIQNKKYAKNEKKNSGVAEALGQISYIWAGR
jgi:hypothetical protein